MPSSISLCLIATNPARTAPPSWFAPMPQHGMRPPHPVESMCVRLSVWPSPQEAWINIYRPFLLENHIQNRALSKFHITPIFCWYRTLTTNRKPWALSKTASFRCPWDCTPHSSAMPLLATSWAMLGALCWVKIKQGGQL